MFTNTPSNRPQSDRIAQNAVRDGAQNQVGRDAADDLIPLWPNDNNNRVGAAQAPAIPDATAIVRHLDAIRDASRRADKRARGQHIHVMAPRVL